jgi:hypothetical protein
MLWVKVQYYPSDEDPINPFGPKPTGPVLPDKSMIASYGYDDAMGRKVISNNFMNNLKEDRFFYLWTWSFA